MKTKNAVNNIMASTFWLFLFSSYIMISNSVSIITASNKPSRVHLSSPTYIQSDKRVLPSSIIISTSFGIKNRPKPEETNVDNGDSRLQVISAIEENRGTGEIGVRDKIKFYKLECSKGRTCSSIIPARTTTPPPLRATRFSKEQLRRYFRLFNPYDKDFESRGSAPPLNSVNKNEGSGSKRQQRRYENYWPGSNYRPKPKQSIQSIPSRAKVVKYETLPSNPRISPELNFPTRKPAKQPIDSTARPWWEEIDSVYPDSENESNDGILYPNNPPRPISRPISLQPEITTQHSIENKGSWRRYGTSTVSQLDRTTGEWVKVSSSNTQLDGTAPLARPFDIRDDVYKASAALTVLGVSDREPHSAFIDSTAHKPHTILVPSADPHKPPHKIETDISPDTAVTQGGISFTVFKPKPSTPSNTASHVSVPLFVIPTNISIQKNYTNSTGTPQRQELPTTTTTTTTTTKRPTTRPTIKTTTTTTTTTTQPPAFLDNPYAVMAAVGAGLIPATFAALLPVFVGGKRKRRRRSDSQILLDQKLNNREETDILIHKVLQAIER